ncbi:MAG: sigma-70 family RNA polymerase sigma factor [Phycicoccus sp.]
MTPAQNAVELPTGAVDTTTHSVDTTTRGTDRGTQDLPALEAPASGNTAPEVDRPVGGVDARIAAIVEQLEACHDVTDAERLRDRLVVVSMEIADAVALRYRGRGVEVDDLLQVARTALVKAARRYRPGAGSGFAAFAVPTISGEVKRHFRDYAWSVRPPRRLQELRWALSREEEQLRHVLGHEPTDDDLALALDVTADEIAEARACGAAFHSVSLDAPTPTGTTVGDAVADDSALDHFGVETHESLRAALTSLTDRERLILRLRFVEERTQSEIGEAIGVSQMQVSRLLGGLLGKLRTHLVDDVA